MHSITGKQDSRCRRHRRVGYAAFSKTSRLFYAVLMFLLLFYVLALVHEAIPGLCQKDEGGEENCPFCQLVHALILVVLVFTWLLWRASTTVSTAENSIYLPVHIRCICNPLRAPPLR
ncbi:MAG: hypothetical protein R6V12_04530 [Candidatus Hydrogenedentota bacterium]